MIYYVTLCHNQYLMLTYTQIISIILGTFAVQRLDSGSLHISEVGSTPLAQALARGVDVQVVFIDQYKGDSQGIYVKPDNDETGYKRIQHPLDLVGRRLGVPFGSTVHYQVLFLLDILKITGKVELVNLSPSEIIKSWNDDSIDAAGCWGPTREYILDGDNPGKVLISAGVLVRNPIYICVCVCAHSILYTQHILFHHREIGAERPLMLWQFEEIL